jgi:hypothetical protein
LIFTSSLNLNRHWKPNALMLPISLRMRRSSWKSFHKITSRKFPTPLESLTEMYLYTRGLFWRNCSLNRCTVLYFSEIRWLREHIKATTCNSGQ